MEIIAIWKRIHEGHFWQNPGKHLLTKVSETQQTPDREDSTKAQFIIGIKIFLFTNPGMSKQRDMALTYPHC